MKLNKIILAIAAVVSLSSVQSCLKDQRDVFEESSSERLQAYLENLSETLIAAEDGWIMEYYPGSNQSRGGYSYHLSFTETEVEATSEIDPENTYKSIYKLTTDNGAVLSFDAYNPVLHYFATPSSTEYQAKGGDFEFTVTSVSPEKIGLVGKRSGNHYDLYPYRSSFTPKQYMSKVAEMSESIRASIIEGMIGETEVSGTVDFNSRRITFSYIVETSVPVPDGQEPVKEIEEVVVTAPYMYTDTGLKTYEPVKVAGYTINVIYYHSENNIMTTGSVTFQGRLPEDYTAFEDFIGEFAITTGAVGFGPYNITLTPNETSDGFILSGISNHFTLNVGYNKAKGRLVILGQTLGASTGSNYVMWCPWSADSGYLTWAEGIGMEVYRDITDPTGSTFLFEDNGVWGDYRCDSFILYEFTSDGSSIDSWTGWGEYRYPYFSTLKRK
ncbi:MAG: DUF4302 domain-containing protein [Bacteroidales bacterium]|nr:DUF4302 domain-containing protein [Bacteroidales bacterium]MDE7128348.1 DUF4302 domain-containing protein [Bacteroidales bacterium]